jgi:hypothetical protein
MTRGVLTVDLDCERCGGTGVVTWREPALGGSVERERRCSCVQVAPVHSEADGGTSIAAPREEE